MKASSAAPVVLAGEERCISVLRNGHTANFDTVRCYNLTGHDDDFAIRNPMIAHASACGAKALYRVE
ncbi:hypothetical protein J3E61_006584 [Mycobacterium sp. OAE908]